MPPPKAAPAVRFHLVREHLSWDKGAEALFPGLAERHLKHPLVYEILEHLGRMAPGIDEVAWTTDTALGPRRAVLSFLAEAGVFEVRFEAEDDPLDQGEAQPPAT